MSFIGNQIDKKYENYPKNDFYSLDRVFGFGSKNNYSLTVNNLNGLIAWVSGPYVIFYDLSNDKQVAFLKNINNKIISCIKFSKNGEYLATGEGNCRNGGVCIYQINYDNHNNEEFHKLILENKIHKYGIDKLLFIKNDRYILSIGNNDDKMMNIMDIQNKQNVFTSKFNRPILSSDVSDKFMILGGNSFIKIYKYEKFFKVSEEDLEFNNKNMEKHLVDLAKLKNSSFVSCAIYENKGESNNNTNEKKIFLMTSDGYLVEMKSNDCKLNRWVHLKSSKGLTLTIWNNMIGCGLGDGLYRIFNADNLGHILTLQRPPPLGSLNDDFNNKKGNINIPNNSNHIFSDIIATIYNEYYNKLIVVYSDKTFFIWDISQLKDVHIYRSNIFQSGGIKAMDYSISKEENLIKIVTCSDDKTVIYWNIKLDEFLENPISKQKNKHITYSKYIRHIFYFNKNNNNGSSDNSNEETPENFSLTSIRFSPDSYYLAIGDTIGNVYIYSLINFEQILIIPTHSGDVNSIDMIKDFDKNETYLSTGGADNFLSIFDISKGFSKDLDICNNILEKMNSSVINVVFCIDKNKNLKLVTAEQNSTITFFLINNNNKSLQTLQKFYDAKLKTYCLNYAHSIQKIISGHNGKISIYKTSSNMPHKHFQVNKGDKLLDNFRIASDSTGVMFATSNNDKIIRIRAFHDGKLLCKIPVSESISSLGFILDDNYLIATSVEGYLYFYKLNQELIKNLKKNNDLINSTEEKTIINNKLKLLQKFMENDASLSKNEQVKYLLDKFQKSEETTIDDLKILNVFVKEGKKKHQDITEENKIKKSKEIIELKEDKPNNNDDQENENNDEESKDKEKQNNNNCLLNKSKIFEKELRENSNILSRKSFGRVSLTDTYKTNIGLGGNKFPKIKIIDKDKDKDKDKKNRIIHIPKNLNKLNNSDNGKNNISLDKISNGEHIINDNYDNDKTLKKEEEEKKNINKKDMSNSQLKIMELKEMINNATNIVNNVDLKVKQDISKNNTNHNINHFNNNYINHNNESIRNIGNVEKEKDINNDILDIDDIKLENDENKNNILEQDNININEEIGKKNFNNNEKNSIQSNLNSIQSGLNNINNLNSIQSTFKGKIIDNTQSHISQKYQYLTITQTTLGLNSLIAKKKFEGLIPCLENTISIVGNNNTKKNMIYSKENNFVIKNDINNNEKDKLINDLQNINIDLINNKDHLKHLENNLESLLNNIRIRLGYQSENVNLENILEKYSILLMDKIDKINKNK